MGLVDRRVAWPAGGPPFVSMSRSNPRRLVAAEGRSAIVLGGLGLGLGLRRGMASTMFELLGTVALTCEPGRRAPSAAARRRRCNGADWSADDSGKVCCVCVLLLQGIWRRRCALRGLPPFPPVGGGLRRLCGHAAAVLCTAVCIPF